MLLQADAANAVGEAGGNGPLLQGPIEIEQSDEDGEHDRAEDQSIAKRSFHAVRECSREWPGGKMVREGEGYEMASGGV